MFHHVVCCIASNLTHTDFMPKHWSLWFLSQSHQSHKNCHRIFMKITWICQHSIGGYNCLGRIITNVISPSAYSLSQQLFEKRLMINCWGSPSLQWWCRGPSSPGLTLSSSWRRVRRRWSSGRGFQLGSQSCKGMFRSSIFANNNLHAHIHASTHLDKQTHTQIHTYMRSAHTPRQAHKHTHKYTHTHMYMHTYTHK